MRVVVSLTTLPDRYDHVAAVVTMLEAQTYPISAIYLGLPAEAARLKILYPPLPEQLVTRLTVVPLMTDYGPVCKLAGALLVEKDPTTLIITVDDDAVYASNLVETIVKHATDFPGCAVCGSGLLLGAGIAGTAVSSSLAGWRDWRHTTGFVVPEDGRNIDAIIGVSGVGYRRGFFPVDPLPLLNRAIEELSVFCNDDLFISAYLCSQNIPRRIFTDFPAVGAQDVDYSTALSQNFLRMIWRFWTARCILEEWGWFHKYEPVGLDESVGWQVGIPIVCIILLLLAVLIVVWVKYLTYGTDPMPVTK